MGRLYHGVCVCRNTTLPWGVCWLRHLPSIHLRLVFGSWLLGLKWSRTGTLLQQGVSHDCHMTYCIHLSRSLLQRGMSHDCHMTYCIHLSRSLLQRGIRRNPQSHNLWHEAFRLELLHVDKVQRRQKVLGLEGEEVCVCVCVSLHM